MRVCERVRCIVSLLCYKMSYYFLTMQGQIKHCFHSVGYLPLNHGCDVGGGALFDPLAGDGRQCEREVAPFLFRRHQLANSASLPSRERRCASPAAQLQ